MMLMSLPLALPLAAQDYYELYKAADAYYHKYADEYYYGNIFSTPIPDKEAFIYSVNTPDGTLYYRLDAATGKREAAFDADKLASALSEKTGEEVTPGKWPFRNIEVEEDGIYGIVIGRTKYTWDSEKGEITGEEPFHPRRPPWAEMLNIDDDEDFFWGSMHRPRQMPAIPSPDETKEAYVEDFNLFVRDRETGEVTQLSSDGTEEDHYMPMMIRWSPDSKKIVAIRSHEAWTRQLTLVVSSPKDQLQPKIETYDYRKPGDDVDINRPVLFVLDGPKQIEIEFEEPENQFSIGWADWSSDGSFFTFDYNKRGHQQYIVYKVDGTTGECTPIVDERSGTFIYYSACYEHKLNDKEMLWISERDGWKHLYLYDMQKCKLVKQLTKGDWVVKEVIDVDDDARVVYLKGCGKDAGEDPYFEKIYKLDINSGKLVCLTPENATHSVVFSHDKKYLTDQYSRPDMPPVFVVRSGKDGKVIAELERGDVSRLLEAGWQMPEDFCAKGRDGVTDIWGTIVRPVNYDPEKKYPIIEYIYAGPQDSFVEKKFGICPVWGSELTELGVIVVAIDGMGTYNRSKAFHDVCYKNLKDAGFPDRIAWMKAAAEKYPYMDVDRVGVFGCSAGGQNAMGAVLFHPEFYKVAVAACGCHDNRMDKMWWNEQWMGYPIGPEYAESSNMENADLLEGHLMLILGELDNNVDPSSTIQVIDKLIQAGKEFEFVILPNERHTMGGDYGERKRRDFFVRYLLDGTPPDWNAILKAEADAKAAEEADEAVTD